MTQEPFLPYAKQSIDSADVAEVSEVLLSSTITRGPKVEAFEKAVAEYCEASYAVAFNSGTSALLAACAAAEVNANDRIITTPNTFVASCNAGVIRGATPVFIDIDRATGNIDLGKIEHSVNIPSTRGKTVIVPVHFSGIAVDMQHLDGLIKDPKTIVIEDAAHAIGTRYKDGQKVGSCAWSQMTMFSFHPAKTITSAEGGMVTTNDEELYHRLCRYRNNGIERNPARLVGDPAPWYYEVQELSNNLNFTEMQAALGLSQLKRLDIFVEKRRELVAAYRHRLSHLPHIRLFTDAHDHLTAFHLFVVQIDYKALNTTRTEVMNQLNEMGIGTQVHYIPVYRHPYYAKLCGDIAEYFPEMEAYYSQALSLPLYYDLSVEDVDRVVKALKKVQRIK